MHAVVRYERLGLLSGRVRDLGTGGLGLATGPIVLPPGAWVTVHLCPSQDASLRLTVPARVAWVRYGDVGVTFGDLPSEVRRRLHTAVYGRKPGVSRQFRKRFHG